MSGGSFDYASGVSDLDELLDKRRSLTELAERLYDDDIGGDDAAADLEGLLAYVRDADRRVNARLQRLGPVMHAVEWKDSGDWGIMQVRQALARYRGTPLFVDGQPRGGWAEVPRDEMLPLVYDGRKVYARVADGAVEALLVEYDAQDVTVAEVEELFR